MPFSLFQTPCLRSVVLLLFFPPLKGDKLMRLPSHTFDKSDLMRSVSMTADGPEEIIEAEDYLQPQEPQHSPHQIIFENNNSPSVRNFSLDGQVL